MVSIKPKIRELEKMLPEKEVFRTQYYDMIYLQKFTILETQIRGLLDTNSKLKKAESDE